MSDTTESHVVTLEGRRPDEINGPDQSPSTPALATAATEDPEVVDAELVDDEPSAVVAVDQAHDIIDLLPWQQIDERRPVIPPALSKEHRGAALRWYTGRALHRARYHTARLPWYQGKTFLYAPRGLWRIARHLTDWVTVVEAQTIKRHAVRHAVDRNLHEGHMIYQQAERVASPKIRARRIVLAAILITLIGAGVALWFLTPTWVLVLTTLGLVDVIGYAGRPIDRPLISPAVIGEQYVKLTSDMVVRALSSAGIAALSAKDAKITFPSPIQRDGDGWRADIDLPGGTTATEVCKARPKLASGLRRPLGCVWPEGASDIGEHRLVLLVRDKDLAKKGHVQWPLASSGRHNFFERVFFGVDPRGRPITMPLFQHNILMGSLPGQGKTNAVLCLACGMALDPTVELWVHDLGKGDLDPLECISHRFTSGVDDDSIAYAAKSLRLLRVEVERRATNIKKIPKDMCPDGKRVSREIADKRGFKMWPIVCIFDECQNVYGHSKYGKQAGDDTEFIIRLGRALGVVLILATQRPDKDALPTGVSGNVSIRFCLYVAGQVENDMILGTSSYQNGLRATSPNLRPEIDAGIGILKGATPVPVNVKVAYFNQRTIERVVGRARAMREKAGTLSGVAIGDTDGGGAEVASLLDDLVVVYAQSERADRAGVWSEELCVALAELRPEVYSGWEPETLAVALRPYAVRTVQLHMPDEQGVRRTRYGLRRELIDQALAVREERRKLDPS